MANVAWVVFRAISNQNVFVKLNAARLQTLSLVIFCTI